MPIYFVFRSVCTIFARDNKSITIMADDKKERYINPYTDFGFKKLFGTEMNKELLISFLNSLFGDTKRDIVDVKYLNSEHLGDGYGDRRAVFDVYCMTDDGGRFIVEMLKAEQDYFKDRSIYYSTFAIREQAPKDYWDYFSTMKTAKRKAREEEKVDTVFRLKSMGLSLEQIAQGAGLDTDSVKKLIG